VCVGDGVDGCMKGTIIEEEEGIVILFWVDSNEIAAFIKSVDTKLFVSGNGIVCFLDDNPERFISSSLT
jgi:hypothetical protein